MRQKEHIWNTQTGSVNMSEDNIMRCPISNVYPFVKYEQKRDQVETRYDKFYLCDVFRVMSKCFTEIEKAACSGGICK